VISDQEAPNGYTIGTGRRAKAEVERGRLDALPREDVQAVAAHKIGQGLNLNSRAQFGGRSP